MFIDTLHNRFKLYFFEGETSGTSGGGTTTAPPPKTEDKLTAAINKATTESKDIIQDDKVTDKSSAIKTEDKKETKVEDKKEDDKKEELNEEQLKQAVTLFKALSNPDPKVQRASLDLLVKMAGLELKEIETKKEATEAKETLVDLLKAGLGEYDFLAERIAPALEKSLKKLVDENTKDIREEVRLSREEKVKNAVDTGIEAAFGRYENAKDLAKDVNTLMDENPKSDKISWEKYFNNLIVIAAGEKGLVLKAKGSAKTEEKDKEKESRNRNDAHSRLASERTSEVKEGVKSSQRKGLDHAVRDAIEQSLKKMNA